MRGAVVPLIALIAALLLAAPGLAGGHAAAGGALVGSPLGETDTSLRSEPAGPDRPAADPGRPGVAAEPHRTVEQGIAVDFEAVPLAAAGGGAAAGRAGHAVGGAQHQQHAGGAPLREGGAARFRCR